MYVVKPFKSKRFERRLEGPLLRSSSSSSSSSSRIPHTPHYSLFLCYKYLSPFLYTQTHLSFLLLFSLYRRWDIMGRGGSAVKWLPFWWLCLVSSVHGGTFYEDFEITWGGDRAKLFNGGRLLSLSLDKVSGSGFQSKKQYLFGRIDMQLKLVAGNSAGTVTAYYVCLLFYSSSFTLSSFSTNQADSDPRSVSFLFPIFFFLPYFTLRLCSSTDHDIIISTKKLEVRILSLTYCCTKRSIFLKNTLGISKTLFDNHLTFRFLFLKSMLVFSPFPYNNLRMTHLNS